MNTRSTISALCYSICDEFRIEHEEKLAPPYNEVVEFVINQQKKMARYFYFPLLLMTLCFSLSSCMRFGNFFHQLNPEQRKKQIQKWRMSKLIVLRDFIQFYDSLTILALYARLS